MAMQTDVKSTKPLAATGAFKKDQIIESINGQTLKDIDPRIQLGRIIEAAEATDSAGEVDRVVVGLLQRSGTQRGAVGRRGQGGDVRRRGRGIAARG